LAVIKVDGLDIDISQLIVLRSEGVPSILHLLIDLIVSFILAYNRIEIFSMKGVVTASRANCAITSTSYHYTIIGVIEMNISILFIAGYMAIGVLTV
jgi:hypothetical protein